MKDEDLKDVILKDQRLFKDADNFDAIDEQKYKKLHQKYKGLSSNVVKEAFGWNEDYVIPDAVKYPQQPGLASGPN